MPESSVVRVYVDDGVAARARTEVPASIAELIAPQGLTVETVNAQQILSDSWAQDCRLLVMPGGRDRAYQQKLSGLGNQRIRDYVEKGGSYLGLCAGGYYGCSKVEFDVGLPTEIQERRELQFFNGAARGPAYGVGTYSPDALIGVRAAPITLADGTQTNIFYNGGAVFVDAHRAPSVRILASYDDIEGTSAAAIECSVSRGKAILTGLHPEYRPHLFSEENTYLRSLKEILVACNAVRQRFMNSLLVRLGV